VSTVRPPYPHGRCFTRAIAILVAGFVLSTSAPAYYYYIQFYSSGAPFNPVPKKFDLNTLANNAIPFFVSDQSPTLVQGDSFQAIISEIRAAADSWNSVASSQIRLAYGGLYKAGAVASAPGIDVEFSDDIPPGLLALSGPTKTGSVTTDANGNAFVPIIRSTVLLPSDLTQIPDYGPITSYSEQFFVTLVHEFGHTLGLQHTLASSVMSTLVTSASSKATPLGPDDIAAISLLYPTGDYASKVGSISGQVTMQGNGVNLASVVAISATNAPITTLTNPDGTYQINGIKPGQYFVYVHPLPPAMQGEASPDNIVYPLDSNGKPMAPNYVAFGTQFYPGTRDQQQASSIKVTAGKVNSNINFNVNPLTSVAVSAVRTYGFSSTNTPVASPPLRLGVQAPVAASGMGLLQANNVVTPGLSVGLLGGAAQVNDLRPYPPPVPYIAVDVLVNLDVPGPKHLLFYTPNDLYVLPGGFTVVHNTPPSVSSVAPTYDAKGNRAVAVSGTQFQSDTRIIFDGLAGVIQGAQSDGSLLVTPPLAPGSYISTVVALNSDGQSSLFLAPNPPTYTYDPAGTPALTVTPSSLSPGADITVDVQGQNTNFIQDQTAVGFGTSDILVKQVNVLNPTHLTALVAAGTKISTSGINITTGLQIISQPMGQPVTITDQAHK
jgi:hypothetical protein